MAVGTNDDGGGAMVLVMAARLLTTGQAAEAMNVHPRTFRRWVADGWVKPSDTTAGGHYRWDVEDVRRQLAERRDRE